MTLYTDIDPACCNRRSPWGNVYKIVRDDGYWGIEDITGDSEIRTAYSEHTDAVEASLVLFRDYAASLDLAPLRGKDLACWCGLDCACHADILLEMAAEARQ